MTGRHIAESSCDNCGESVTFEFVYLTDNEESWRFCEWSCFDEWYQDGKALGLIVPGVDDGSD